ncbi:hypothetical protein [Epilithonimonas sp.]|uniref:hypothetical protein n=1 Tax=Epilithonimonas sp. TaxID=2894511 RepID=UPI00289AB8E5|nr:hypothetical protein [Epilithonimonas sp.]
MENLDSIIFYNIDKAIRAYRNYAQRQLEGNGFNITIDQWLIIKAILENFIVRRDTRVATLSYTYNFGSGKSGQPRKTGGADDLKQRELGMGKPLSQKTKLHQINRWSFLMKKKIIVYQIFYKMKDLLKPVLTVCY